jgi:hypothetical protein
LKRIIDLYPGLENYKDIEKILCMALCADINTFSYNVMSKVIEYKLAIEWLTHLVTKNLYLRSLILAYENSDKLKAEAKGVHGPYSNLDLPMEESFFLVSD